MCNTLEKIEYYSNGRLKLFKSNMIYQSWYSNGCIDLLQYKVDEINYKIELKFSNKGKLEYDNLNKLRKVFRNNFIADRNQIEKLIRNQSTRNQSKGKVNFLKNIANWLSLKSKLFSTKEDKLKIVKTKKTQIPLRNNNVISIEDNQPDFKAEFIESYFKSGKIKSKKIKGYDDYYRTEWYKNGNLKYQYNFKSKIVNFFYENGQIKKIGHNGLKEWYENGVLKKEGEKVWYESGKILKDGVRSYYENGQVMNDAKEKKGWSKEGRLKYDIKIGWYRNGLKSINDKLTKAINNGEISFSIKSNKITELSIRSLGIIWHESGDLKSLTFKNVSEQVPDILTLSNYNPNLQREISVSYENLDIHRGITFIYPH